MRRRSAFAHIDEIAHFALEADVGDEAFLRFGLDARHVAAVGVAVRIAVGDIEQIDELVAVLDGGHGRYSWSSGISVVSMPGSVADALGRVCRRSAPGSSRRRTGPVPRWSAGWEAVVEGAPQPADVALDAKPGTPGMARILDPLGVGVAIAQPLGVMLRILHEPDENLGGRGGGGAEKLVLDRRVDVVAERRELARARARRTAGRGGARDWDRRDRFARDSPPCGSRPSRRMARTSVALMSGSADGIEHAVAAHAHDECREKRAWIAIARQDRAHQFAGELRRDVVEAELQSVLAILAGRRRAQSAGRNGRRRLA